MNILFYTDPHICLSSITECELVFDEIIELVEKYKISKVISLGDNFDTTKPSAAELNCLAKFLKKLNNKEVILLAATSHESETNILSSVDVYGILSDTITIVKEYRDEGKLYCGHFIINESKANKGSLSGTKSKKELQNYKFVVLGHGHNFEIIKPNVCQLGSCRYISFGEDENIKKRVGIVTDYGEDKERWGFIELKTPYPIVNIEVSNTVPTNLPKSALQSTNSVKTDDVTVDTTDPKSSISQAQTSQNSAQIQALCEKLDKLTPLTKVRIIFKDYVLWRSFLPFYQKYKGKFIVFRDKKDFLIDDQIISKSNSETQTVIQSFKVWLDKNKIEEKVQKILLGEIQ